MGILKKGLLGLVIAPAVYGGTRSTVNYASKFIPRINGFKDPLIAALTGVAVVTVAALVGNECKCCKKKKDDEAEE